MAVILVPLVLVVLLVSAAALRARPDQEPRPPGHWLGIGIGLGIPIGLVFGTVLGISMDNMALGIALGPAIGVSIGTAIGAALEARHKNQAQPLTDDEQRERTLATILAGVILLVGVLILVAVLVFR